MIEDVSASNWHEVQVRLAFRELSTIELAGFELYGNNMPERLVEKFYGDTET